MQYKCGILAAFLIFSSCSGTGKKVEKDPVRTGPVSIAQPPPINEDSIHFLRKVKSLEDILFYIGGSDSVVVTKDPTDLVELNQVKESFDTYAPDTARIKFKAVEVVRKYHLKRKDNKPGARPSATIMQLTFKDKKTAMAWFNVHDTDPEKKILQSKPKTKLWLDGRYVYFVRTYHTPQWDYVELLKTKLISVL